VVKAIRAQTHTHTQHTQKAAYNVAVEALQTAWPACRALRAALGAMPSQMRASLLRWRPLAPRLGRFIIGTIRIYSLLRNTDIPKRCSRAGISVDYGRGRGWSGDGGHEGSGRGLPGDLLREPVVDVVQDRKQTARRAQQRAVTLGALSGLEARGRR
jgi:hypothetical protein